MGLLKSFVYGVQKGAVCEGGLDVSDNVGYSWV